MPGKSFLSWIRGILGRLFKRKSAIAPTVAINNPPTTPTMDPTTNNSQIAQTAAPEQHSRTNEAMALGWNIVDKLIPFLNVANQALSGNPLQGTVAGPLELLKTFQVSEVCLAAFG
jgi:hypothetical protein